MLYRFIQICLLIVALMVVSTIVEAGNPAPLFDKPVKVDDSGRPMYNSWERYEDQRQKRYQQRVQAKKKQIKPAGVTNTSSATPQPNVTVPDQKVVSTDTQSTGQSQPVKIQNGATSPTPSSVIINRPVQTQGDPEVDLNNFDF